MQLKDLIHSLEELAPLSLQESYDNAGLLVGDPDMEISAALLCLDSTEEVIDEAIASGCQLVIAHHPIIFSGLKRLTGANYIERAVIKAIRHHIAIYAIHTNLDNVANGVNAEICRRIGILSPRILQPMKGKLHKLVVYVPHAAAEAVRKALFKAGAGHIGKYDECSYNLSGEGTFRALHGSDPFVGELGKRHTEPETRMEVMVPDWRRSRVLKAMLEAHPYEEVAYEFIPTLNEHKEIGAGMIGELETEMPMEAFLLALKQKMQLTAIRYTTSKHSKVKRVAVCGGSGSFLLPAARSAGAQVFITADYKYHQFFDGESQISIVDIGHYESERFTMDLLASYISGKFPKFAVRFTKVNTNPINYL